MSTGFEIGHGIEYEEGDLIISGGEIHQVEDIPTANISANAMDDFLQEHQSRLEAEKARLAARDGTSADDPDLGLPEPAEESQPKKPSAGDISSVLNRKTEEAPAAKTTPAKTEGAEAAKRPSADAIKAAMSGGGMLGGAAGAANPDDSVSAGTEEDAMDDTQDAAPTGSSANDSGANLSGGSEDLETLQPAKRPAATRGTGGATSSRRGDTKRAGARSGSARASGTSRANGNGSGRSSRRAAPAPKKSSSTEIWLYVFIGVCVIGGGLNFWLNSNKPEEPVDDGPTEILAQEDRVLREAKDWADEATTLTLEGRKLNMAGDKAAATEKYQEAQVLWGKVFYNLDWLELEKGIDIYDRKYGLEKPITKWTQYNQECQKFQVLDDFDYEAEMQAIKEKARLEAEQGGDEDE